MKLLNYLSSVKWPWLESKLFIGFQRKIIIINVIFLSILLSGKFRCFGVVSATFNNQTCARLGQDCSSIMFNLIGVLCVAISLAGSPFVTGFFLATKSPALGGRISVHFSILVLIGCLATSFVINPNSLIFTDSIIQGIGLSVLISILAIRITEIFPREHRYHIMVSAFTDAGPWGTIIICPIFGVISQVAEWQQVYVFFGMLLSILILVMTLVEPRVDTRTIISNTSKRNPYSQKSDNRQRISSSSSGHKCPDHPNQRCPSYKEVNEIELWGGESDESVSSLSSGDEHSVISAGETKTDAKYTPKIDSIGFKELFMSSETKAVMTDVNAVLWLTDRALHAMVQYGLVLNLVDYMVVAVHESLEKSSLIMMSLGAGEVIGFVIATGLGDQLRHHLIHIYTISTGVFTCILGGWQLTQRFHISYQFSNGDAHFLSLISGIVMAFCSSYTFSLAEDLMNRPGIISYPLTRFFQAIGVIFVPLTSGLVITLSAFEYFFLVQTVLTAIRFVILCWLVIRIQRNKKNIAKNEVINVNSGPNQSEKVPGVSKTKDHGENADHINV